MIPAERIAEIRAGYEGCFGCGPANPIGLRLDAFEVDDGLVRASFDPRPDYSGFGGVLHGGIVATALDEIMAWTAILIEGVMVMTGTLELRYRSPAPVDTRLELAGQIVERRGRRLTIRGEMTANGSVLAQAKGLFLATEDLG